VTKRFRVCDLDQPYLLPPSLQDWLPENHLARFIAEVTNELDLSAIYAEYERQDGRGLAAYHPLLLTRLLLYGYAKGVTSSRRIEQATHDDVAFRYLAANQHPDHDTLAHFRRQHLEALASLFLQALRLCQKAGLVKLGNVAIDGTKILANASTSRSVPYQKLVEREQYWKEIVGKLLAEAQRTDEQEDQQWSKGQASQALPAELSDAKRRLERIQQAKTELEREAQEMLEQAQQNFTPGKPGRPTKEQAAAKKKEDPQQRQKAKGRLRRARRNAENPTRQYNFVDPDSRVMMDTARDAFAQAYNAQAAADGHAQVIVAAQVSQDTTDRAQLLPMVQAVREATGSEPAAVTADAGYWDTLSLRDPSLQAIDVLVSPDSKPQLPDAVLPPTVPHNEEARKMRERLASETGKALYSRRKAIVEPVFGQIKEARGIRRFRLRGLKRVAAEWKLICATHNLLKLFRFRLARPLAIQPAMG
jgi:transposase